MTGRGQTRLRGDGLSTQQNNGGERDRWGGARVRQTGDLRAEAQVRWRREPCGRLGLELMREEGDCAERNNGPHRRPRPTPGPVTVTPHMARDRAEGPGWAGHPGNPSGPAVVTGVLVTGRGDSHGGGAVGAAERKTEPPRGGASRLDEAGNAPSPDPPMEPAPWTPGP